MRMSFFLVNLYIHGFVMVAEKTSESCLYSKEQSFRKEASGIRDNLPRGPLRRAAGVIGLRDDFFRLPMSSNLIVHAITRHKIDVNE